MKKIITWVLSLMMALVMSGCFDVKVSIEGDAKITIDKEHLYKAVVEDETVSVDAYKWAVITSTGEYQLLHATNSEVTFSASDGGNYTLKVTITVKGKESTAELKIAVEEIESINGYILPPEPDETLNNSTLLGIDSNDNGVRDDVERWVIKKYATSDYPKTKTAIAMQWGRATQQVIQNPESAYEDKKYWLINMAMDCQRYAYNKKLKKVGNYRIDNKIFDDEFVDKAFNTKERIKAYYLFNANLAGHVYGSSKAHPSKCDFDIDGIQE